VDGRLLGAMLPGHDEDDTLTARFCWRTWRARRPRRSRCVTCSRARPIAAADVRYVINCGEEAVGDRYQRAAATSPRQSPSGRDAGGPPAATSRHSAPGPCTADLAGALVRSGLHDDVLVVAGGSLAKLG